MRCESLSASKIKTYGQCPFKFLIEYHLKMDTGRSFPAEQGSLVHFILERFAKAKRDGVDEKGKTFDWLHDNYRELLFEGYPEYDGSVAEGYRGTSPIWQLHKSAPTREKSCETCPFFNKQSSLCLIANQSIDDFEGCPRDEYNDACWLIEKIIHDKSPNSPLNKKIIDAENKFQLILDHNNERVITNGLIDVVTELDENTIEIHDYKTGNYIQSYNECKKDPQLLIYHLAATIEYPKYEHVIMTIYYLRRKGGPITLAFNKEDNEKTELALMQNWDKIRGDRSPVRRAERSSGAVRFDHICKNLCNINLCEAVHNKFMSQGGVTSE